MRANVREESYVQTLESLAHSEDLDLNLKNSGQRALSRGWL